jgi:hypothetical protein
MNETEIVGRLEETSPKANGTLDDNCRPVEAFYLIFLLQSGLFSGTKNCRGARVAHSRRVLCPA